MKSSAIIGLSFGDEGKGRVVDYLCGNSSNSLVIRFSGGHQAGHHVIRDEIDHVFSNFGSGTLCGKPTYWSKKCTIDPIGIVNELKELNNKGIKPVLYINKSCPVTTPYDKYHNISKESKLQHGSCGVGFGTTIEREENKYSLVYSDLFNIKILQIKMNLIRRYYGFNTFGFEKDLNHFISCVTTITSHRNIFKVNYQPIGYSEYIFEGSQGLLLDQNFGFFPHVTRSNTGLKNLLEMGFDGHIYLVTRAYQTRHGYGPMTNESYQNIKRNPYEKNDSNGVQGKFRETMLDLDLLRYAINKDDYIEDTKEKSLVITCMDLVKDNWAFTLDGKVIRFQNEKSFVIAIKNSLRINNVYLSYSPDGDIKRF